MLPLQTFKAGVEELVAFLESIEHQTELNSLLLQHLDGLLSREQELLSQVALAGTESRRYIYCVAIISLYGLLERLIDTLIATFIEQVAQAVDSYEMIPKAIRDNHVRVSLEFSKALAEDRHRTSMKQEEVIANLHSCLSSMPNFRINGEAFVLHRGNITLAKISNFLSQVGINSHLKRITLTQPLIQFFSDREPERDLTRVADQDLETLLMPIDDLVERRNEISHGVINVDDIESIALLKERCSFLLAYAQGLDSILFQELLGIHIERAEVVHLGIPIIVHNKEVVCFEVSDCTICEGDLIVAATENPLEPFRYGPILSIEVDRVRKSEIVTTTPIKFGAKVPFQASNRHQYYLLPPSIL